MYRVCKFNSDTHQLEYLSRAITRTFCSQVEKAIIYSSREKAEYLLFLEPEAYVKECMIRQTSSYNRGFTSSLE